MELFQTVAQFAWIGWIVLILVFVTIETLTLEATFLMLGIGGVAGLASAIVGAPLWLQVVIAALVAAAALLFLRPPLLRRLRRGEDPTPSNVDALLGMPGSVVSTVTALGGQVRLANGDTWSARADTTSGRGEISPGIPISVIRIDGATAVVRPHPQESDR